MQEGGNEQELNSTRASIAILNSNLDQQFENAVEALEDATKLLKSIPIKGLRKFLRTHCDGETLGVADSKLENAIKEKLKIDHVHNTAVLELLRGVRTQLTELVSSLDAQDLAPMSLGLSHSLSRYKLKFSDDKVDTMIVQAIAQLSDYLKIRMNTVAPNLIALVGAHLIAHGGSLLNLSKQPGSTVQILGEEKALFKALKTKHSTQKYGLIYHASLVGQATLKRKGKISRSLAAKAILAICCDTLGDGQDNSMGLEYRAKLEGLRALEGKELGRSASSTKGKPKIEVYDKDQKKGVGLITPAKAYNPAADYLFGQTTESTALEEQETVTKKKKKVEARTQEQHI
ncbi:Nucleolar protein 58 [Hibiscus syriacus]|uniref:Nucleolar protein 58 n=1 Tax=Hibiscus syriacus TaxID=106335 RepID=A0A6A2XFS1_HIBSY|nr:Nucleolar protein 58 [Hibiscus syriacus]